MWNFTNSVLINNQVLYFAIAIMPLICSAFQSPYMHIEGWPQDCCKSSLLHLSYCCFAVNLQYALTIRVCTSHQIIVYAPYMSRAITKQTECVLRPAWIQTNLHIRAVWSGYMLFTYKHYYKFSNWWRTSWFPITLCWCACWSRSMLVLQNHYIGFVMVLLIYMYFSSALPGHKDGLVLVP
jgi:hypothetical protein